MLIRNLFTALILLLSQSVFATYEIKCNATPSQIWSSYNKWIGNNSPTNDKEGIYYWAKENAVSVNDFEVIKIVLSATQDWSFKEYYRSKKTPSEWDLFETDYEWDAYLKANKDALKTQTILNKRCKLQSNKSSCPEKYLDINECLDFYYNRYEKVTNYHKKFIDTIEKSYTLKNDIINLAFKDFNIAKDTIIPSGNPMMKKPFIGGDIIINKGFEEQAILNAENQLSGYLNPPKPTLTRGEFESKKDYENRTKKVVSAYKKSLDASKKNSKEKHIELLIHNLNNNVYNEIDYNSIKYDIDNELLKFDIIRRTKINHEIRNFSPITATVKIAPKSAKKLKQKLLLQRNSKIEYKKNLNGKKINKNHEFNPKYSGITPYLFYTLNGNELRLAGGYLINYKAKETFTPIKISIKNKRVFKTGKAAAKKYDKIITGYLNNEAAKKRKRQQAQLVSDCDALKTAYLIYGNDKLLLAMTRWGCN